MASKKILVYVLVGYALAIALIIAALLWFPPGMDGGGILSGIFLIVLCTLLGIISNKSAKRKVQKTETKQKAKDQSYKTIMGMIKTEKKLDLNSASKISGVKKDELKQMIYTLAADDKVSGKFEGDVFVVEQGIDLFVERLDNEFSKWSQKEEAKTEKFE